MKSNRDINKQNLNSEDESFVSPKLTDKERQESLEAFKAFRRKVELKRTPEDNLKIQLLQLKFLMEDHIKSDKYDESLNFTYFLRQYIERLAIKNNEFADDISINPTELSQIINKHREPNPKLFMRLEAHSNKNFPAIMWFSLLLKDKALELIRDESLRIEEDKQVKKRIKFSL